MEFRKFRAEKVEEFLLGKILEVVVHHGVTSMFWEKSQSHNEPVYLQSYFWNKNLDASLNYKSTFRFQILSILSFLAIKNNS